MDGYRVFENKGKGTIKIHYDNKADTIHTFLIQLIEDLGEWPPNKQGVCELPPYTKTQHYMDYVLQLVIRQEKFASHSYFMQIFAECYAHVTVPRNVRWVFAFQNSLHLNLIVG
jgi:hypothetical protein